MSTLQKYLTLLAGLGAGYLVVTNPNGVYKGAQAFQRITGGTIAQITTGGKRGG